MISLRKICVSGLFVGALAGCDSATAPAPSAATSTGTTFAAGGSTSNPQGGPKVSQTKIVDLQIDFTKRPVRKYAGLNEGLVLSTIDRKTTAALAGANPGGTVKTKAVLRLRTVEIATATVRRKAYDSVIGGDIRLFNLETGERIGGIYTVASQATYRPAFAGGRARVLSPKEELELITTHAATKIKEQIYE